MALSTRRPGHASGLDGELVAMIGSRDARYAETRKETQISSCLFAGNTSAINYSLRTTQVLDMAESGGDRLRPNRHPSFTATNRQGLAQKWRCKETAFRYHNEHRSRCIDIIYHNTCPSTVSGIVFLADTLTARAGCSSRMDLMQIMQILLQALD
jgi:hypothetical protein